MKLGVLFSGGKDSTYAACLAKRAGHEISCFLTVKSSNKSSFMFHTPAIDLTAKQAELCGIPILSRCTVGEKEKELKELRELIEDGIEKYGIEGVVTGAVESVYQASRVQEICNDLGIECFNPLWQKDQWELLDDLISEGFDILVVGVFAYPFDDKMIGRKIDGGFLEELRAANEKLEVSPAGEGGEFETMVVNCPLFSRGLDIKKIVASGEGNSWRGEVVLNE
jgi:diphthine-ammonia ligase